MRGLGMILAYIMGNKKARDWCIDKICQASCIVENEFKKTPLWLIFKDKKDDDVLKAD